MSDSQTGFLIPNRQILGEWTVFWTAMLIAFLATKICDTILAYQENTIDIDCYSQSAP